MVSKEQEKKMIEETIKLVNLFLQTNASDIELEKLTGISSSTVGRRLTNKQRILAAFPFSGEDVYKEIMLRRKNNLHKAKVLGGQTSMINNIYLKDEIGKFVGSHKLRLDVFYDDADKQMMFLLHLALTFRLKPSSISDLFQIDEKELLEKLVIISGNAYNSLLFLIYHETFDQNVAKTNVVSYYRDLLNAKRKKDDATQKELLNKVTDALASEIIASKKSLEDFTLDELEVLLRYQLKYTLSIIDLANTFNIDAKIYEERVPFILEHNPDLKERYEFIISFNLSSGGRK